MKEVTSTDKYTVFLRRDGRHAVIGADKKPINGDEKVAILLEHGLVSAPTPKAPEPEEAATEDSAEDAGSEESAGEAEDS